jgi:hypothetical protein
MERHRREPHIDDSSTLGSASPRTRAGVSRPLDGFAVGARIEVRDRFRSNWNRGFEIAEHTRDGYRIRRTSDRYVLPGEFVAHEVRRTS